MIQENLRTLRIDKDIHSEIIKICDYLSDENTRTTITAWVEQTLVEKLNVVKETINELKKNT